jgi:uncharacterized protein (TIGR01244 family)
MSAPKIEPPWGKSPAFVSGGIRLKEPTKINDRITAGGQPDAGDLRRLAEAGVKTVINLRREGENNQPLDPAAEGEIARSLGLGYVHLPVSVQDMKPEQLAAFTAAVQASNGPVYVHCGAGQRACALALTHKAIAENADAAAVFAEAEAKGVALPDQPVRDFIGSMLRGRP